MPNMWINTRSLKCLVPEISNESWGNADTLVRSQRTDRLKNSRAPRKRTFISFDRDCTVVELSRQGTERRGFACSVFHVWSCTSILLLPSCVEIRSHNGNDGTSTVITALIKHEDVLQESRKVIGMSGKVYLFLFPHRASAALRAIS